MTSQTWRDRFEIAVIAMDAVTKSHLAKREARHNPPKTDGGAESTQATGTDGNGDRKSTRLNSSHSGESRMPSSA